MKTYSTLTSLFTNLSNNTSAANLALGGQLISDQHRYLIQKYFDNERTYTTTTVGAQSLTLTAVVASGDTSATLTAAWTSLSTQQFVVFSNGQQRTVVFTKGSASISWSPALTASGTTAITTIGVQAYPIPANVSKIKNDTITVGQLAYTPAPVQSIQEWTKLNAIPYTSNIPNYFYIYNNQVLFWPIPSTSGNVITFNYKGRVPDLSLVDYSTGTLSGLSSGGNVITGVTTAWNTTYPIGVDILYYNLFLKIPPPFGDGFWYPIQRFNSATEVVLATPLQNAPSTTSTSYTIGQLPVLQEDFHDMLVFGSLMTYFTSIVDNDAAYKKYKDLYQERLDLLEAYAANKTIQVDLGSQPIPNNPNLFLISS